MKRLSLITFAVLACLSLSACGTNSKNAKRESEASSLKVANSKLRKKAKAQSRKKQHTNKQSSNSSASNSASQSSQQQGQQTQQASGSNAQLPPATDLHDFVNRYGESPAAYLSDHYGMSPEQAVQSVPDNMKSSGEIQDTHMLQQGQDPFK